jgi:hypothetical protein
MKTIMGAVLAILATTASVDAIARAEEGTVKAAATWKARSFAFPVGQGQVYLVGVYSGTFYVDDGKGALHAASIVCPATAEGDLKSMTKTGQGRCILTDEDGNRVYARFTCNGDLEGCRGPFTIVGGTGKFDGITGDGEMVSRILVRQMTAVTGFQSAEQEGEGIATWPSLTYRIPDKN